MENKKIKNATQKEYNGIKFKSLLEVMTYKTLIEQGFEPEYELKPTHLVDGFIPTVTFYTKNTFKRKNHNIKVITASLVEDKRPVESWIYTPDFYMEYKGKKIFIENKGFSNDLWNYKRKLFRKYLETLQDKDNYQLWEIHSKKQLLDCIKILKDGDTI